MKSLKQCKPGLLYLFVSLFLISPVAKAGTHDGEDGDYKVEKKKSYSKSYPLTGSTQIKLDNSFGEMKIITWDKNEAKADVAITVKANTEQRAQELLDDIKIEDGKDGNSVYFKTEIKSNKNRNWSKSDDDDDDDEDDKKGKHKKSHSPSMEINMTVYMPASNPIEALNSFGNMIVPDLTGATEIASKFGSLKCGKLSNNKELSVEFGKAEIEHINGGEVSISYSTNVITIQKMSGDIKGIFEFSKSILLKIDNSLTKLNLNTSYTPVEIEVPGTFSGDFNIKTNFGSFKNDSDIKISEEKDDDDWSPKFDHKYSGKAGNGGCKVKINSSFGAIKIS